MKDLNFFTDNKNSKIFKILGVSLIIVLFTFITKSWQIDYYITTTFTLLVPLFFALFIAWLLNPIVSFLETKKIKRGYGIVLSYLFLLLIIIALIGILGAFLAQLTSLLHDLQLYITELIAKVDTNSDNVIVGQGITVIKDNLYDIATFFSQNTLKVVNAVVDILLVTISSITSILFSIIISIYLLVDYKTVKKAIPKMVPIKIKSITLDIIRDLNHNLGRFVRGMLIDSSIVFLIATILLSIVGLENALVFGVLIGLTNIIQYIGPWIGGTPAVIMAFIQDWKIGFLTLLVIVVIQALESVFLQPVIVGKLTHIHPAISLASIGVFTGLFGIIGAFIATPLLITLKIVITHVNKHYKVFDFS